MGSPYLAATACLNTTITRYYCAAAQIFSLLRLIALIFLAKSTDHRAIFLRKTALFLGSFLPPFFTILSNFLLE